MDAVYLTLLPDAPTTGLVHGTLTDPATGKPVANAVVSSGSNAVYTDANGQFALALPTGSQTITISGGNAAGAPYIDETTVPVTITAGGVTEVTPAISVRPSIDLTTANGFAWKALPNTGGSMDLAGALAAEGSAVDMPVPSSWRTSIPNNNIDQQYGWAILHFTVPADLASQLANRTGIFKSNGIDDVDATYLNGTLIGSTGSFPSTPLPAQAAGYTAPGPNLDLPGGAVVAWNAPRYYTFPASLLNTTGDNVLAIRIYDNTGGGGVTNTPTLVLGPPSVTVSGTVTAGGSPLANVRVAAMDAQGIASDYTMTGADGTYTLRPAAGQVIIGVAIPKYAATSKDLGVLAAGATAAGTNFSLTAIPGGAYAPIYDDFSATSSADPKYYTNLWDPLTELNPQTPTPPLVTEPGFDVNTSNPIPNSITVDSAANERGGILSKARFSKFASVNAARLVSAKPFGSGGAQPNMIFQLYTWQENDPTRSVYRGYVELDAEGYAQINGDQRLQMRMFVDGKGQLGSAAGPAGIPTPDTISPTNPLDFVITRTGTVMDFYVNGQHLLGSNDLSIAGYGPLARMIGAPQKLFPYSFDRTGQITWGSVQAGPVAP